MTHKKACHREEQSDVAISLHVAAKLREIATLAALARNDKWWIARNLDCYEHVRLTDAGG